MEQRGSSLLEVLVALAILGTIAVVFLSAISSAQVGAAKIEERAVAEHLARNQIEDIRSSPYCCDNPYLVTVSPPSEYTVIINTIDVSPSEYLDSLQKVVVLICRGERVILELETYKANL